MLQPPPQELGEATALKRAYRASLTYTTLILDLSVCHHMAVSLDHGSTNINGVKETPDQLAVADLRTHEGDTGIVMKANTAIRRHSLAFRLHFDLAIRQVAQSCLQILECDAINLLLTRLETDMHLHAQLRICGNRTQQ